jgi:heat shock protein HslJ
MNAFLQLLVGSLLLAVLACQTSQMPGGAEALGNHRWVLTELDGQPIPDTARRNAASLQFFTKENRVAGSGGCNRITGGYERTGRDGLKFSRMVSTKMACPGPDLETPFLRALDQVDNFSIAQGVLTLRQGPTVLARLQATAPQN